MNIIAVDDERSALCTLVDSIEETVSGARVFGFQKPEEALICAREKIFEVAFLNIKIHGMTGLELAKRLKDIQKDINIIFVTDYSEYSFDAFRLYAGDYLLKPATSDAVNRAMEHLQNPVKPVHIKRIRFRCFGTFEVFADNKQLVFGRAKSKELLAYLVCHAGTFIAMGDIMTVIRDKRNGALSNLNDLCDLIADLKNILSEFGAGNIILKKNKCIAIDCNAVDCDYYDFLRHIPYAVNDYHGEYMMQYSWAEMTTVVPSQLM